MFGTATGATMMVQYGREASRIRQLVGTSRYLALIAFPVHLGLAAIAGPVMWIIYGGKYTAAVPALVIAACMGIPKAFMLPAASSLSSAERQDLLIRWGLIAGVLNIALDFALIPRYGAVGAALANGKSQKFSDIVLLLAVMRVFKIRVPILPLAKTALISVAMAIMVHLVASRFRPIPAALVAIAMGIPLYLILLRLARVLGVSDHGRMLELKRRVPFSAGRIFEASLNWLIPMPISGT